MRPQCSWESLGTGPSHPRAREPWSQEALASALLHLWAFVSLSSAPNTHPLVVARLAPSYRPGRRPTSPPPRGPPTLMVWDDLANSSLCGYSLVRSLTLFQFIIRAPPIARAPRGPSLWLICWGPAPHPLEQFHPCKINERMLASIPYHRIFFPKGAGLFPRSRERREGSVQGEIRGWRAWGPPESLPPSLKPHMCFPSVLLLHAAPPAPRAGTRHRHTAGTRVSQVHARPPPRGEPRQAAWPRPQEHSSLGQQEGDFCFQRRALGSVLASGTWFQPEATI